MNQADFDKLVRNTVDQMIELLVVKGGEYAGSDDRLANFKRGAGLTGATPMQVLFIYLSKHYDAVATYIRDEAAGVERRRSESIRGRIHDALNYLLLLEALVVENEMEKASAAQSPTAKTQRPKRDRRSKRSKPVDSGGVNYVATVKTGPHPAGG